MVPFRSIFALLAIAACGSPADGPGPVRIYVAASAGDAVQAALHTCAAPPPDGAVVVPASSARLARQIEHGAPADLFISASAEWMDHLADRGQVEASSRRVLMGNSLVVVASTHDASPLVLSTGAPLTHRLGTGRLAVGDPEHVPAGRYAREAFENLGLWADVAPRLAPAADVRAALMLVERGEAPLGVVYASDAEASDRVAVVAAVPADAHTPIEYPLAIVAGRADRPGVQDSADCLWSAAAQQVFAARGFEGP